VALAELTLALSVADSVAIVIYIYFVVADSVAIAKNIYFGAKNLKSQIFFDKIDIQPIKNFILLYTPQKI